MEQFLFSNFIGLPVASLSQQKKLGQISSVLVGLETMEVKGFLVKKNLLFPFSPALYLGFDEVVEIEKEGLMVRDEEVLSPPQEIVRVANILRQKISLIGLPVKTKSGKYLGRVFDFTFDKISGKIQSFYVSRLLSQRIISRSKVIEVDRKKMTVENDIEPLGAAEMIGG